MQYTTPPKGRISINLVCDEQNAPMHFDVRYNWYSSRNVVVINSLRDNKWENEEKPAGFPFQSGYLTTVRIVPDVVTKTYRIFADGKPFYEFKFRTEGTLEQVKYVAVIIDGVDETDVQVTQLMVSLNILIIVIHLV